MPTFLEKTWTDTRPKSGKDSGIAGAIKIWDAKCPDNYDTFSDPTVLGAAMTAADGLLKAIKVAEGKINGDKSTDDKTKKQIAATKVLLGKWETEIKTYKTEAGEWVKKYMLQQGSLIRGNEKNLVTARELLYSLVVVTFENSIDKLPEAKTQFDTAIKNRQGDVAGAKLDVYRKRVKEGAGLSLPKNVVKAQKTVAERYEVPIKELPVPTEYEGLKQKFAKLDKEEDAMQAQLEKLVDELASVDAPISGKTDENYKKTIGEVLTGYKKITQDVKGFIPGAARCLSTAQKIKAVGAQPNLDPVKLVQIVDGARKVNELMFDMQNRVIAVLSQTRNSTSPLRAKAIQAGLTPEDNNKVLMPQMNAAYAANKNFLSSIEKAKELIQDFLEDLVAAKPELKEAATELANMGTKYKVNTQV